LKELEGFSMRKFVFNTSVLGSIFGAWSIIQTTRKGPRDWRLVFLWVGWAATVAVAIGTVAKESKQAELKG
jgi:phosphatidylserine synthase